MSDRRAPLRGVALAATVVLAACGGSSANDGEADAPATASSVARPVSTDAPASGPESTDPVGGGATDAVGEPETPAESAAPDTDPPAAAEPDPPADPAPSGPCPEPGATVAWSGDVSEVADVVRNADGGGPGVALVQYPHPDYEGRPWSQWGQGIVLPDGRHLSAIGDHLGADGNSYVYEYDPATMQLTLVVDVLATVPHQPGDWGFGKIHAQMVEGACGEVLVSTYWGSRKDLEYTDGYRGDVLLRLDTGRRTVEDLGVILPEHGVPSLAASPDGALLYGEAADPFEQKQGSFVVLDAASGDVVFEDDDPAHGGFRSIAVAPDGTAYVTWDGTGLARYDPAANTLTAIDDTMPGATLRAATRAGDDGRVFAVSQDPEVFFTIDAAGTIDELGPAEGYTTSMALAPADDVVYYVPDAKGDAWVDGTPLYAVDTATGRHELVVELNPLVEERFGLRAGGSYSVAVSDDGRTVYVGLNVGDPATDDSFGEVVLAIVTLP